MYSDGVTCRDMPCLQQLEITGALRLNKPLP